jgi:hypothetical protein
MFMDGGEPSGEASRQAKLQPEKAKLDRPQKLNPLGRHYSARTGWPGRPHTLRILARGFLTRMQLAAALPIAKARDAQATTPGVVILSSQR